MNEEEWEGIEEVCEMISKKVVKDKVVDEDGFENDS